MKFSTAAVCRSLAMFCRRSAERKASRLSYALGCSSILAQLCRYYAPRGTRGYTRFFLAMLVYLSCIAPWVVHVVWGLGAEVRPVPAVPHKYEMNCNHQAKRGAEGIENSETDSIGPRICECRF